MFQFLIPAAVGKFAQVFRRLCVLCPLGLMCCAWANAESPKSPPSIPDTPNIIVIYTDDQGYGDMSALNAQAKFQTPHLDRLANEGILFTNGHSSAAVCTPSRYGILTGRYCWRTKRKRGVLGAEAPCLIDARRQTLASLLQARGYRTALVGKWHLGMDFPGTPGQRDWSQPVTDMPLDKGFDYFFGVPASLNFGILAWFENRHAEVPPSAYTNKKPNQRMTDYRIKPPYQATPDATLRELGKRGFEVAPDFVDNQCLTRFTDQAIHWIGASDSESDSEPDPQPFFLFLAYTSPHYPVCPLPEFHGQGECGAYGEFVIETDHHVGRLLEYLDKQGLSDNTLIVFTSDNGPERHWRQSLEVYGHDSRGGFREGKRSVYEGGHRVPFAVRWPRGIEQPGRRCDALVGQVDLLATVAEVVGLDLPPDVGEDSQSFAQVLKSADYEHQRLPLINHGTAGAGQRYAITDAQWKLILPAGEQVAELYDLAEDPAEENNVAVAHPDRVQALTSQINRIITRGRTTTGPAQANDTGYWPDLAWLTEQQYQQQTRAAGAQK